MISTRSLFAAVIVMLVAVVGVAQADVIFGDNFNVSAQTMHVNNEYDGGRQAGVVGPLMWEELPVSITPASYLTSIGRDGTPQTDLNTLVLMPCWGSGGASNFVYVSPRHNFTESSNFEIEFDVDPVAPGSWAGADPGDWVALSIGNTVPGQWPSGGDTEAAAILFRDNGNFAVLNQNVYHGEKAFTAHAGFYHLKVAVTYPSSPGSIYSLVKVYVDNVMIYEFESLLPNAAKRITLSATNGPTEQPVVHLIDNFQVSVPGAYTIGPDDPFFTPAPGSYAGSVDVKMASAPAGTTIRYTTDNSEPSLTNGDDYTAPVTTTSNTTFKAKAFKDGLASATVTSEYSVSGVDLFKDDFDTSAQSFVVDFEYDGGRQTGLVAPLRYDEDSISAGIPAGYLTSINNSSGPALPGALLLAPQWGGTGGLDFSWVSPKHSFSESDNFEMSFDIDPLAPGTWAAVDKSDWTSVHIGTSDPGRWPSGGDTEGASMLFRADGRMAVLNQNVYYGESPFTKHEGYYHVRVKLAPGGTPGLTLIKVYVDDVMIKEWESLLPNGLKRITLGGVTDNHQPAYHPIDNFKVSTLGPYVLAPGDPSMTPAAGSYTGTVDVKMSTTTAGATIRYTIDGSEPSLTNGTDYNGDVATITSSATVKAKAFKDGVASGTAANAYTLSGGDLFKDNFNTSAQSFLINFEYDGGRQSGAYAPLMYDEEPTSAGVPAGYLTSINNAEGPALPGALLIAPQWGGSGGLDYVWVSPQHLFIESTSFEICMDIDPVAPGSDPIVDPSLWTSLHIGTSLAGQWPSGGDTEGASMLFRANGNMAVLSQNVYHGEKPFAMHDGYYRVRVKVYPNIGGTPGYSLVKVYVDDVMIYEYESMLPLGAKRITLSGVTDGTHHPAYHPIDNFKVSASNMPPPAFSPVPGNYTGTVNVSIASLVPGATIRYTTDNSEPTSENGTTYAAPIAVTTNTTFKAKVFMVGWVDSATTTASYSFSPAYTVSEVKQQPDNTAVYCNNGIVTADFGGFFYIEDEARSVGIMVAKAAHGLVVGDKIGVGGTIKTNSDHERYIEATNINKTGTVSIAPLGMPNKSIGGGDFEYSSSTGAGQQGITGASGLNNIGLLVKVWGQVTAKNGSTFTITDGSGFDQKVAVTSTAAAPETGYYMVTGISSCEYADGNLSSVIRVRSQEDLDVIPMGTVLFSDNFNTSTFYYEVNAEYNLGRQSGSLAPLSYAEDGATDNPNEGGFNHLTLMNPENHPGTLTIAAGAQAGVQYVWVSPNHNFKDSGQLEIWFEADPVVTGSQNMNSDYFLGLEFGADLQGDSGAGPKWTGGMGLIVKRNGKISLYDSTVLVGSETQAVEHPGPYQVRVTVDTANYTGSPATIKVYVDGVNYFTYTREAGFMNNYITLCTFDESTYHYHTIDNFTVLIPN